MAAKKKSAAFELVVALLQKNPNIEYKDVEAAASKRGHKIYPIVYGRAKRHLGMTSASSKKPARKAAAGRPAAAPKRASMAKASGRPVGRPRKNAVAAGAGAARGRAAAGSAMGSLEAVIEVMKSGELERDRMRVALEQIQDVIASALD